MAGVNVKFRSTSFSAGHNCDLASEHADGQNRKPRLLLIIATFPTEENAGDNGSEELKYHLTDQADYENKTRKKRARTLRSPRQLNRS